MMGDQAQRLREIASQQQTGQESKKKCQVYCITSGKGGVGKTSFSVNFAIALSRCGKKVMIIDADFGLSNVNILLGTNSKYNMSHVLNGEKKMNEVMEECFPNVWHISGGAGMSDLVKIEEAKLASVMRQMAYLEDLMDYILIDTGAGINDVVLRMISASDHTILLMTAEPTSLIDSYVVLKTASVLQERPDIHAIVNKAASEEEAQKTFESFSKVASKHLHYNVNMMGYLPRDNRVTNSISSLVPFVMQYPASTLSSRIQMIANDVTKTKAEPDRAKGIKGFFNRFFASAE
ncbi:P-loop NTPase [Christensenellaceae bacterium OttesenSCG-928-K19]|nr:P-loop NTPase [Christensenellaceae bacterium OttesenSCG-928-K19]